MPYLALRAIGGASFGNGFGAVIVPSLLVNCGTAVTLSGGGAYTGAPTALNLSTGTRYTLLAYRL